MERSMESEGVYKREETVSFYPADFDEKGNIKASSLMRAFQDIAAAHAEQMNLGFEDLMAQNYIWVLSKLRFRIKGTLGTEEKYCLKTYPRPKKGVIFLRDYYIIDSSGDTVVEGTSHWCIINFKTRRIERTKIDFDGKYIDYEPFENGIEKFKVNEEALAQIGSHQVTEEDLDKNRHLNNCRYADMVETVLQGHTDFRIYFSKEALLGDNILLYKAEDDEYIYVEGKLEDGTVVFQAKVK